MESNLANYFAESPAVIFQAIGFIWLLAVATGFRGAKRTVQTWGKVLLPVSLIFGSFMLSNPTQSGFAVLAFVTLIAIFIAVAGPGLFFNLVIAQPALVPTPAVSEPDYTAEFDAWAKEVDAFFKKEVLLLNDWVKAADAGLRESQQSTIPLETGIHSMTRNELHFFNVLVGFANCGDLWVDRQVRLGSVFSRVMLPTDAGCDELIALYGKKVADYVLTKRSTGKVLAIIELDDITHDEKKRNELRRDEHILRVAHVPTLRVSSRKKPDVSQLFAMRFDGASQLLKSDSFFVELQQQADNLIAAAIKRKMSDVQHVRRFSEAAVRDLSAASQITAEQAQALTSHPSPDFVAIGHKDGREQVVGVIYLCGEDGIRDGEYVLNAAKEHQNLFDVLWMPDKHLPCREENPTRLSAIR